MLLRFDSNLLLRISKVKCRKWIGGRDKGTTRLKVYVFLRRQTSKFLFTHLKNFFSLRQVYFKCTLPSIPAFHFSTQRATAATASDGSSQETREQSQLCLSTFAAVIRETI